jgi:hypothetical protein
MNKPSGVRSYSEVYVVSATGKVIELFQLFTFVRLPSFAVVGAVAGMSAVLPRLPLGFRR